MNYKQFVKNFLNTTFQVTNLWNTQKVHFFYLLIIMVTLKKKIQFSHFAPNALVLSPLKTKSVIDKFTILLIMLYLGSTTFG